MPDPNDPNQNQNVSFQPPPPLSPVTSPLPTQPSMDVPQDFGGAGAPPPPVFQTQEPSDGGPKPFYKKIPLKIILFVVLALALVGAGAFALKNTLFKPKPQIVTLTWWGLWEDDSIIKPIIADYENKNTLVKINYIKQSPKDYRERLVSALAKGTGAPDIFRFHNTWVPMLSREFAVLPADVMNSAEFSSRFYPVAARDLTTGGKIVGVPLMIDGLGLYVNEDIFTTAGVSVPTNWDDLRRAALALTVRNEDESIDRAGVALGAVSNVDHWQDILALMMLQNGADLAKPVGKSAQDAISFYTIFTTSDKVWDSTLPPSTAAFAAGKAAMYFAPSWRAFDIKKQSPDLKFKIVPVPQLPKSKPEEKNVTWASYWAEGVWVRSINSKQAFEFLKYLTEKENLQKLYTNEAATRVFGEPYSRQDMATLVEGDPFVGAYVKQAPNMSSWYLASNTNDGPTGINSRLSKYFEDAVNKVLDGTDPEDALKIVEQGIAQILSSYGAK